MMGQKPKTPVNVKKADALPPMTIRFMSVREYATHRGVRHIDVRRALAAGRIHLSDNGLVEPLQADKDWAATAIPLAPTAHAATVKDASGRPVTFAQARTEAELLKQQSQRLRLAKQSGELVDRSKAINTVFGLARRERDAWQGWPARSAALMAAELNIDAHRLEVTLDKFVRDHLKSLADVTLDLR